MDIEQHTFKQPTHPKRLIRKYFEINKNENTIYQNLWDAVKVVLR